MTGRHDGYRRQPSALPAVPDLDTQPPNLAADLLLLLIDEATGKLRTHPRVAGVAVAGALLLELCLGELVTVLPVAESQVSTIKVSTDRVLPADPVLRCVVGHLLTEPEPVPVMDWIEYLAPIGLEQVSRQLERAGWVRRSTGRRHAMVLEPVNRNTVFWRPGRLCEAIGTAPSWLDVALLALVDAVGITPMVLAMAVAAPPAEVHSGLLAQFEATFPTGAELLRCTQRLVTRIAMAR